MVSKIVRYDLKSSKYNLWDSLMIGYIRMKIYNSTINETQYILHIKHLIK